MSQRLNVYYLSCSQYGLFFVQIGLCLDIDEWEAEYRLIAENSERRGESETDPVKKGRQAAFLKEYWGVRDGSAGKRSLDGQNVHLKDVAETIGENEINIGQNFARSNDVVFQRK
ncbi:hypothetical protein [Paenibacillus sp. RC343]|uniref:hypothetical protein n=1 Tax=Paenibacillus sp. RC343 TaxID=3045841 RepID=UPI0024B8CD46|nr:hypothetical protein [Paenibacillus sp. RC343]